MSANIYDRAPFIFLANHGIQTPISAIRWGVSRLKKTDKGRLSAEQHRLLTHIEGSAQTLSRLLSSMVLLARNESESYIPKKEKITMRAFLRERAKDAAGDGTQLSIVCPTALSLLSDRTMLHAIFSNLLSVFGQSVEQKRKVYINVRSGSGAIQITLRAHMDIPLLATQSDGMNADEKLVGGPAGVLLSLAQSLSHCIDGFLVMSQSSEGEYVIDLQFPLVR